MKPTHKAKRIDNYEWVEGWYYKFDSCHYLRSPNEKGFYTDYQIDPSTLCERVRGTDLFEGDILTDGEREYIVTWRQCGWYAKIDNNYHSLANYRFIATGRNKHD